MHALKTRLVDDLIPKGAESFATVQEVWDAHVHVLRTLGADPTIYGSRLARDFELMARELGQPFSRRIPTPDSMLHSNGFPRFVQNADEAWVRVVTR